MLLFLVFIFSLLAFPAYGVTIGSDTAVNRFNAQQVLNNGDRIAGFAALEGGFQLLGMNTTATFDSVFPVSGNIQMNGGTLVLNQDLIFSDVSQLLALSNVVGNGHTSELAPTMTCVPGTVLGCPVALVTSIAQNASVFTVGWSFNNQFVAAGLAGHATGDGAELRIYSFDGTSLTLTFTVGINEDQNVYDLDFHPFENYLAVGVNGSAAGGVPELYIYSLSATGTLTQIDSVDFGTGGVDVASVRYHPSGNFLLIGSDANPSELVLYPLNADGTLRIADAFSVNIAPNQNPEDEALSWNSTGSFFAVGLSGGSLQVYDLSLSASTVSLNAETSFGTNVRAVAFNPRISDLLAIGLNAVSPRLQILRLNPSSGTFTTLLTESTNLTSSIRNLKWHPDGTCLALGKNGGPGGEFRVYEFDYDNLTLNSVTEVNNGSTRGLSWSSNGQYIAVGTNSNDVEIYRRLAELANECVTLSNLNLVLNCNVTIKNGCFKFAGNSSISGQGMVLSFDPTCTILVDTNSSLLIKDVALQGIVGTNLSAVDETSTFSFQDVRMFLDGNYSFTVGKFDVVKDFEIIGNGKTFIYRTDQVSTVSTCGRMILDTGVTFSYDPRIASQTLFQLADATSELWLNSATLYATGTGLQLTKGHLVIDGYSFLSAQSSAADLGIRFGDGTFVANNLCIEILPAATLQVSRGLVENSNV